MFNGKVCVIGAGVSGLVVCKYLKQSNIEFDCFEKSKHFGGLWNIENNRIYESLHINTTKRTTGFEDFAIPSDYPEFCSHNQILKYLYSYAMHFDIYKDITFGMEVVNVGRRNDDCLVKLGDGNEKVYEFVIIATGHHWKPQIPDDIKTTFKGGFLHSSAYKSPLNYQNKKVLVVGIGNSAVDIACDIAKIPNTSVEISTRNSTYIYPHYFLGKPLGNLSESNPVPIPKFIKRWIGHIVLYIATGNQQKLGIPKPSFKLLNHHSTVSTDIFSLLSKGRIRFRPGIQKIEEQKITFLDNTDCRYDTLIACTGYKVSVPFLSKDILDNQILEETSQLSLYKRILLPKHHHILFVGFVQPNYSVFRTAEEQAKWIVALLNRSFVLPGLKVMKKEMDDYSKYINRNFYQSNRHTIQVDYLEYIKSLREDYK